MRIVQIVPRRPPPPEGVGSYAEALASALREESGIETRFVVRTEGLEEALDGSPVLLHYVGYGYHPRGCPRELVRRVTRLRLDERARLVTFFHEVYATGPPWRSSFWLSGVQRRLSRTLAQASDAVATSLDLYAGLLKPWVQPAQVVELPVFSTVGEPASPRPLDQRRRQLVVFGGSGVRARAFGEARDDLAAACSWLGIEEIVEVGPPIPVPRQVAGLPVRSAGTLPAAEVGELLSGSYAGFLAYPPRFLGKSTVFAAYCAHGVVPLCAWRRRHGRDAAVPCFVLDGSALPGAGEGVAAARHAWAWYRTHTLARQAQAFRSLLFPCAS